MGNALVQNVTGNGLGLSPSYVAPPANFSLATIPVAPAFNQSPIAGSPTPWSTGNASYLPGGGNAVRRALTEDEIRAGPIVPPTWQDYPAQAPGQVTAQYFDQFFSGSVLQNAGRDNALRFYDEVYDSFQHQAAVATNFPARDATLTRWNELNPLLNNAQNLGRYIHGTMLQASRSPSLTHHLGLANPVARDFFQAPIQTVITGGTPKLTSFGVNPLLSYWRDYPNLTAIRDFYSLGNIGTHVAGLDSDYDPAKACLGRGDVLWWRLPDALAHGLPGKLTIDYGEQDWWDRVWGTPRPFVESMDYTRNPSGLNTTLKNHLVNTESGIKPLLLTPDKYRVGDAAWVPHPGNRTTLQWREIAQGTNAMIAEARRRHGHKWWYCHSG